MLSCTKIALHTGSQGHIVNQKKFLLLTNEVLLALRVWEEDSHNDSTYQTCLFLNGNFFSKGFLLRTSYFINGKQISNLSLLDVRELVNQPSTPICD